MSCPDCGASVEEDQQFCRSCGRDLLPDVPRRMRPQVVMLMTFMLTFVGVGVALSGDMASIRWLKFTGIFIALAGMFSIIAASILIGMRESGSQKRKTPDVPVTLDRATTNKLLPVGE